MGNQHLHTIEQWIHFVCPPPPLPPNSKHTRTPSDAIPSWCTQLQTQSSYMRQTSPPTPFELQHEWDHHIMSPLEIEFVKTIQINNCSRWKCLSESNWKRAHIIQTHQSEEMSQNCFGRTYDVLICTERFWDILSNDTKCSRYQGTYRWFREALMCKWCIYTMLFL